MALMTAASGVSPASAFGFSSPCVRARDSFSTRAFSTARCCTEPRNRPSESSALFSNRLLVQAGPKPRLFTV